MEAALSVSAEIATPPPAGPLAGVRVVDLSIWMAGSIAGMLLGDLGADVVKVESPAGDPARAHAAPTAGSGPEQDGISLSFTACNRNKRSIVLDLRAPSDLQTLHELLAVADVFVTNLSGPALRKLRVDDSTLSAAYPRLVYARAAGLGTVGPRADDLAQDMTGMAYGGMLFTMSPEPEEPFAPPGAMNDVLTGTMVAFGVLAALADRERTGHGGTVSGSLLQTALWSQMLLVGSAANTAGASTTGRPRRSPRNALLNQYRAGDGRWIAVAAINARAWPGFVEAAELDEVVATDPRFASYADAQANVDDVREFLDAHFATRPAAYWLERFRGRGVWSGPVNHLDDVLVDEHIRAEGYLATLSDGVRTVTMPFALSGWAVPQAGGPALGADRDAVLRDWLDH